MDHKHISKFLSLVLRHEPGKIEITLDEHGWTDADELIRAVTKHGVRFDRATLLETPPADFRDPSGIQTASRP